MNIITIIGSHGFLGKNIKKFFKLKNYKIHEINRFDQIDQDLDYGIVFYCAGITKNFSNRIIETIDAHVNLLAEWLRKANFKKIIYLSSTRFYTQQHTTEENIETFLIDRNDIYNQTKIMGELVCQQLSNSYFILRLSNILNHDHTSPYFFWHILNQAKIQNEIHLKESEDSIRDYFYMNDFLELCDKLITSTRFGIYNVASGYNLSHKKVEKIINQYKKVNFYFGKKKVFHPQIVNEKTKNEFNIKLSNMEHIADDIIKNFLEKE